MRDEAGLTSCKGCFFLGIPHKDYNFHLHLHPPPTSVHPPTGHLPIIYLSCILHQTIPPIPPITIHSFLPSLTALFLDIIQTSHSTFPYSLAPDSKARSSLLVPVWLSLLPVNYLRTSWGWGVCVCSSYPSSQVPLLLTHQQWKGSLAETP